MYDYDIHEAIYQYRQYEINVTWFRGSGPGAGPIIMASENVKKYFTIIEDKLKATL